MYYNNYDNYVNNSGYNNCVCYPNDAHTNVDIMGEHWNNISVHNDTDQPVRTFFIGLGPHCSLSLAEGIPFVCYDEIIQPRQTITRAVKGWANSVAAIDPNNPKRSCGYKDLFTSKGDEFVRLSAVLKGTNKNCSSLLGVVCNLLTTAYKIPWGVGKVIEFALNPLINCSKKSSSESTFPSSPSSPSSPFDSGSGGKFF